MVPRTVALAVAAIAFVAWRSVWAAPVAQVSAAGSDVHSSAVAVCSGTPPTGQCIGGVPGTATGMCFDGEYTCSQNTGTCSGDGGLYCGFCPGALCPGPTPIPPTKKPTTTTVASWKNPAGAGDTVNFAATVTPSTAEGWMYFWDGASKLASAPVVRGVANFGISALTAGSHSIKAIYAGDGLHEPSESAVLTQLVRAQAVWHHFFAVDTLETPMVGDFNGDHKTDVITFTRQNPAAIGDVYVALSNGGQFVDQNGNVGSSDKWHDWFAITTDETVVIGDYDGDGKDDIATWLGKSTRQVYVARSLGTSMEPSAVWLDSVGLDPSDVILSGDVNGDHLGDLICFARKQGKVYVALSNGASFQAPTVWHDFFAVSTYERPRVADVNGDGRADIVTFATDSPTAFGDVYVAVSDGTQFVDQSGVPHSSTKWHDWFSIDPKQQIRVGDINSDGEDDFFTFLPPPFGQCYTVQSLGTRMDANVLWREIVTPVSTDIPFVGDVNGDGKADIIVFAQGEGRVYVSLGT